ncbi:DNA repair ATPase [Companilactobacillus sp. RD055328]|uniref:ATP-binding protein n=1 Tax=Companilactobacillus sp. RD055328 TaxID=2916634 RepID=UPI001FC82523|nr:AAA family ATPase [Companilactobacillus sp. RD055328]GKQ42488.1 DNA repair ATPase [Companilactobacillus sp. RD055328]
MYIKSANIFGFGKLVDQKFDFQQDYQVIRGFNESGKTTLLAFIKAVLFGFEPGNSTDEQYIPKNANQYGGELVVVDNGSQWLIRRVKVKKVIGDVTVYKDDVEFPDSALKDLLKNVDKDLYSSSYILNQKNLGSFDKLERDELIDNILTVGAVGGNEWLDLVKQLDSDAGDIYKTSKNAKKPLNMALREYNDLISQQSSMQDQKAEFAAKNAEQDKLIEDIKIISEKKDQLFKQVNQQQNVLDKKSEYDEYLTLIQEFSGNNFQTISNSDWDRFTSIDEQIKALKNNLESTQANTVKLSTEEEMVLNNYESNEVAINKIHDNLDDISHKEFNLEQLNTQIQAAQAEKNTLLTANTKLAENMTSLSNEELSAVNNAIKQDATTKTPINLYLSGIAIIIAVIGLLLPGALKAISIIAISATIWFWYQHNNEKKSMDNSPVDEYLAKHNYRGLTLDEAVMWQPQIVQLQSAGNRLTQLTSNYQAEKNDLDAWQKEIDNLNIVTDINVKSINAYFEQLNYLHKKQNDIQETQTQTKAKVAEINQQLVQLNKDQKDIVTKYQLSTVAEFSQKRTTDLQLQKQLQRIDVLKESLDNDLLEKITKNPDEFDKVINELTMKQEQLKDIEQSLNDKKGQLAQLQVEINNLANDEDYLRLERVINDKQAEIIEYYDDWVALKLGSSWVYDTLNLASSNRFPKMLERTKRYFAILTTDNYNDVKFGEKTIEVQSSDFQKFELHELSTGTIAQLFIALRCAFVMEISDLVKLPILIDDAFNDFDRDRYEAAANLIKSMSQENQIFYVMTNNIPADYFDVDHVIDLGGENDK